MDIGHLRNIVIIFSVFNSLNSYAAPSSLIFDAPIQYESGGVYPDNIRVDDINSDGHKDVMITSESNIHFLLGDGTGALNKDNSLQP